MDRSIIVAALVAALLPCSFAWRSWAEDISTESQTDQAPPPTYSNRPPTVPLPGLVEPTTAELLRQWGDTLKAVELTRQETESNLKKKADQFAAQFQQIEQALLLRQEREKLILIAAGFLTTLALLGLVLAIWLLSRATDRFTSFSQSLPIPQFPGLASGPLPLVSGDITAGNVVEQVSNRFITAMDRLEKRILELEHAGQGMDQLPPGDNQPTPPDPSAIAVSPAPCPAESSTTHPESDTTRTTVANAPPRTMSDPIAFLFGRGETLLRLEKPAEALACFEEILALDPAQPEACLKRGAALEKLWRIDDAIQCYDRALELDRTLTAAYLCKGAALNRLKRFSEAMECYEQALSTERNSRVA